MRVAYDFERGRDRAMDSWWRFVESPPEATWSDARNETARESAWANALEEIVVALVQLGRNKEGRWGDKVERVRYGGEGRERGQGREVEDAHAKAVSVHGGASRIGASRMR